MNRKSVFTRQTLETDIEVSLDLTQYSKSEIDTGIGFFDHMLVAMAFHGGFGLKIRAKGDLHVDCHHTIEDVGIALGKAFSQAAGDRMGMERFGTAYVPMDEALAFVCADIGGRAFLAYQCDLENQMIGNYQSCMTKEFLRAFSQNALITIHAEAKGENAHHITEALFKAIGRALKQACSLTGNYVASTKGVL